MNEFKSAWETQIITFIMSNDQKGKLLCALAKKGEYKTMSEFFRAKTKEYIEEANHE